MNKEAIYEIKGFWKDFGKTMEKVVLYVLYCKELAKQHNLTKEELGSLMMGFEFNTNILKRKRK